MISDIKRTVKTTLGVKEHRITSYKILMKDGDVIPFLVCASIKEKLDLNVEPMDNIYDDEVCDIPSLIDALEESPDSTHQELFDGSTPLFD